MPEKGGSYPRQCLPRLLGVALTLTALLGACETGHGMTEYDDVTVVGWSASEDATIKVKQWAESGEVTDVVTRRCLVGVDYASGTTELRRDDACMTDLNEGEWPEEVKQHYNLQLMINEDGRQLTCFFENVKKWIYDITIQYPNDWKATSRGCGVIVRIDNPEHDIIYRQDQRYIPIGGY